MSSNIFEISSHNGRRQTGDLTNETRKSNLNNALPLHSGNHAKQTFGLCYICLFW